MRNSPNQRSSDMRNSPNQRSSDMRNSPNQEMLYDSPATLSESIELSASAKKASSKATADEDMDEYDEGRSITSRTSAIRCRGIKIPSASFEA